MTAPRPPTQPPVTVRREPPADTGLHGRWLLLAHAGWAAVMLLTLGFLILAVPYRFRQARAICVTADCPIPQLSPAGEQALRQLGLSLDFFAANVTVVGLVFVLIFVAVGGMIVWRRSDDWMALYVSLTLVLSGSTAVPFVDVLAQAQPDWRLPLQAARAVGLGAGLLLLFIFPNGRFVPGWTRWFALGLGVWIVVSSLNLLAYASQPWWLAFLGWFGIGVWAQLYRYRRVSTPVERQQTKWVVFGCAIAFLGLGTGVLLPSLLLPGVISPFSSALATQGDVIYSLIYVPLFVFGPLLLVPLTIGVSVLRYRLWDVDPIVNRTLVYTVVTAGLLVVYLGSVIILQRLVHTLTGQAESSLVVVVSTLAAAALFQPVRQRVQAVVDRHFYRRKYDAARTLATFSATLRDEVDLNRLTNELVTVVDETMQPTAVSLWLRPSTRPGAVALSRGIGGHGSATLVSTLPDDRREQPAWQPASSA